MTPLFIYMFIFFQVFLLEAVWTTVIISEK